jgi:hypothetical protein
MFARAALFAPMEQTLFNIETIERLRLRVNESAS